MIVFNAALDEKFRGDNAFDQVLALEGEVFRNHKGRKTLRFYHEDKGYFLKIHPGVGWCEIFKNLLYLRFPVLGARHERDAILALERLNIPTMKIAGYGVRGNNPATMESFLITEEIVNVTSLEDLTMNWRVNPPKPRMKRALIGRLAAITRAMHQGGVNHRDFYLCHFLLEEEWLKNENFESEPPLYVIDLHRAQIRSRVPERWLVKDLAGLFFSSMNVGLSKRDLWRYIVQYENKSINTVLNKRWNFWVKVGSVGKRLYRKHG